MAGGHCRAHGLLQNDELLRNARHQPLVLNWSKSSRKGIHYPNGHQFSSTEVAYSITLRRLSIETVAKAVKLSAIAYGRNMVRS